MVPATNGTRKVIERSWDEVYDAPRSAPLTPPAPAAAPEPPARTLFRHCLTEMAIRAHETIPGTNGRIFAATKIVLAGDVELLPDGTAKVGSQSDSGKEYFIVNGHCECQDAQYKAPSGWCKHRLAHALHKRTVAAVRQRLDTPPAPLSEVPTVPDDAPLAAAGDTPGELPSILDLPEAPCSINVYIDVAGRKAQLTLRDTDEGRLLSRLEALLTRFPLPQASAPGPDPVVTPAAPQAPPEGWCVVHSVQMRQGQNERGSWWSHNVDGAWCKGK